MKCEICGKEIEETFLGKLNGAAVRIKKGESVKVHHVCSECQREYHGKIKEKIIEMQ